MTTYETIEDQIRRVLATETGAASLSEKLFSPSGLFNQLARTEQERKIVVLTPLFGQAQDRFHELQQSEAKAFSEAISQLELPPGKFRVKIETSETR